MKYRLLSREGSISHKLFTLEEAKSELNSTIVAIVTPVTHKLVEDKQ